MLPLILYDLPSKLPENYWSPNPTKPRFVLSYKGLPFQTEWVEYPDIASRMKEIGASPSKFPEGDVYTVPVLHDPNTGAIVTDSFVIAEYLDKTYPEKPIFPHNSKALIRGFENAYMGLTMPAVKFALVRVAEILNKPSQDYFVTTREKSYGEKFEDFSPEGSKRDAHWAIYEKGLDTANAWYERSDGKWVMGDTFSYADIIVASRLEWWEVEEVGRGCKERMRLQNAHSFEPNSDSCSPRCEILFETDEAKHAGPFRWTPSCL